MYTCAVSADLKKYERQQDLLPDASDQEAEIESAADDLMLPQAEFYPYSANMLGEAISECDQAMFDKLHMIAKLLEKSQYEAAGAVLNSVLTGYCKQAAISQIKRERYL